MSTNVTVADQRTAIGALAGLAGMFGHLPAGYIGVDSAPHGYVSLSLATPADMEAWREALGVAPSAVELFARRGNVWLTMDASFLGATVHVSMHQVPVSFEAASVSPAEDAAARLAVESSLVGLPAAWHAAVAS